MQIQFYAKTELDTELRTTFKLPADPYTDDSGVDYLRQLGVIFYRDADHAEGIVIQPADSDDPIEQTGGFLAHYSEVELSGEGTPVTWEKPTSDIVTKRGDDLAWRLFNQQRIVEKFDSLAVHYV